MKKIFSSTIGKCFLYTLLVVVFYSCESKRVPINNYKGGIVYSKIKHFNKMYIDLKKDSLFKQIRVYELDYDLYKVGDTIK